MSRSSIRALVATASVVGVTATLPLTVGAAPARATPAVVNTLNTAPATTASTEATHAGGPRQVAGCAEHVRMRDVIGDQGRRTPPGSEQRGGRLDGFVIGSVPNGLGSLVSDFDYEWEGVAFASRVWETGPDEDGAYQVDLSVKVLRGDQLADAEALRDFLAYYHENDVDHWELTEFDHPDGPGHVGAGEAFWLVEPGVAVSVRLDERRFENSDLMRTACGVRGLGA